MLVSSNSISCHTDPHLPISALKDHIPTSPPCHSQSYHNKHYHRGLIVCVFTVSLLNTTERLWTTRHSSKATGCVRCHCQCCFTDSENQLRDWLLKCVEFINPGLACKVPTSTPGVNNRGWTLATCFPSQCCLHTPVSVSKAVYKNCKRHMKCGQKSYQFLAIKFRNSDRLSALAKVCSIFFFLEDCSMFLFTARSNGKHQ